MSALHAIVAATDLSTPAADAAERAALLAQAAGARLTLVHALSTSALEELRRGLEGGDAAAATLQDDARARLHEQAAALARRHGLAVDAELALGNPVEAVGHAAERTGADLVVTGTRGAGLLRGVVIGSTAERIAARSARPALMVRRAPAQAYRRVLVALDFSPCSAALLALAARVAPAAELVLLHAVELPFESRLRTAGVADTTLAQYRERMRREARARLEALAAAAGLAAARTGFATPDGADPWMQIVQAERAQSCDLVAIGRQGRSTLQDLLLGSTTRTVMAEGSADVLVAPQPAA
ncbi:universal stress protein [Piscinibacter defluvii]|uniref:universal stress protein n=1 Tax=Piscinibacter defluvii TaxID=1796922 RepID=UPI000FDD3EB9|nr:universal stress protein [Piscinibacter defluvii]